VDRQRVILVTGAASGIGAAACRALAAPGAALLVHTRKNRDGAERVAAAAQAAGADVEVALGDLVDATVADALVAQAVTRFGGLDVLVSNAGFADRTPAAELTDAAMAASVEAIQGAFFRLVRAAVPHLKAGHDARVVGRPARDEHHRLLQLLSESNFVRSYRIVARQIVLHPSAAVIPAHRRRYVAHSSGFGPTLAGEEERPTFERSGRWEKEG